METKLIQIILNYVFNHFDIIRRNENDKIYDIVTSGKWDPNIRNIGDDNLLDIAARAKNVDLIYFLIDQKTDTSRTLNQCTGHYINMEAIKCLISKGVNIDTLGPWKISALGNEIKGYASAYVRVLKYKDKNQYQYDVALKVLPGHEERMKFYLSLEANSNKIDNEGNDYKTVIGRIWVPERPYYENEKIVKQIDKLINEVLLDWCRNNAVWLKINV